MIHIKHKGNFGHTEKLFSKALRRDYLKVLKKYGDEGLLALAEATPKDSGQTANGWGYEIETKDGSASIYWTNNHIQDGVSIALILQTGHGTRNGGYVEGRDYINPAIAPIFDRIAKEAWKEVTAR